MEASLDMFYNQAFKLHMPLAEVLISKIAYSTLCALDYMQSKEIIHQDVKPSNVLVNLKGEIKLCDFGISGFTQNSVCTAFQGSEIYMSVRIIYIICSKSCKFGLNNCVQDFYWNLVP